MKKEKVKNGRELGEKEEEWDTPRDILVCGEQILEWSDP